MRGSVPDVNQALRTLRARLDQGRGVVAIWTAPIWAPEGEDVAVLNGDDVEIKMQHVEKRISALTEIRGVLEQIDPAGETIYGGDLTLEPLPL